MDTLLSRSRKRRVAITTARFRSGVAAASAAAPAAAAIASSLICGRHVDGHLLVGELDPASRNALMIFVYAALRIM